MKQVFMQKKPLGPANVRCEDVPAPRCGAGSVLISNRYSLISAGTETAAVKRNLRDMVVKAATNPDIRQSVIDMLFDDGISKTVDRVNYEMTKWTPLGYSGCGVAIEVGQEVTGIQPGDLVTYAGEGHAEIIRAPKNLVCKVPEGVPAQEASFVALGSIALQSVRRCEPQVGEVIAVLGLGLVGQLVSQLLQAAGARVIGSDIVARRLELAKELGLEQGFFAGENLPKEILSYTGGLGADKVMICASTASNTVVQQAVAMARDRGRIVVVGMVGLDVPCEQFYMKELDLVISRSYGPGRYDRKYEEQGHDYPISYVRWTEQRNMQEFLRLVQQNKVRVKPLITHEFPLDQASEGYKLLMEKPAECLAVVMGYDQDAPNLQRVLSIPVKKQPVPATSGRVAVIGCGAFARQFHLPFLRDSRDLRFELLVASSAQSAREMGQRYGAARCATDVKEVWSDPNIDAVMIFTRDNAHASQAVAALEAGKHVFCEKPLTTNLEDCEKIRQAMKSSDRICFTGFNRRFAPMIESIKKLLSGKTGPKMIHYRINAGKLPKDNWVFDPVHAAGRIVGEVCHFVDLCAWLIGSEPITVSAQAAGPIASAVALEDIASIFRFADGSVAHISYTSQGAGPFGKERLEVFCDGLAIGMDDYRRLTVRGTKRLDEKHRRANKGHTAELAHFTDCLKGKTSPSVTARDGLRATICCLSLIESARTSETLQLDPQVWDSLGS